MSKDVLEVLNDAKRRFAERGCSAIELGNAIDKLSELIAADVACDKAETAWDEAMVNATGDENPGWWRKEAQRRWQKLGKEKRRRSAALAACRGL